MVSRAVGGVLIYRPLRHLRLITRGFLRSQRAELNKVRYVVERAIANLKNWRVFHTDYRRPLKTFAETIPAVLGLYFYTTAE